MNALPSYLMAVVEYLRERGHKVDLRCNKHGSWRYKLDESHELNAQQLIKRANRLHGYRL